MGDHFALEQALKVVVLTQTVLIGRYQRTCPEKRTGGLLASGAGKVGAENSQEKNLHLRIGGWPLEVVWTIHLWKRWRSRSAASFEHCPVGVASIDHGRRAHRARRVYDHPRWSSPGMKHDLTIEDVPP